MTRLVRTVKSAVSVQVYRVSTRHQKVTTRIIEIKVCK